VAKNSGWRWPVKAGPPKSIPIMRRSLFLILLSITSAILRADIEVNTSIDASTFGEGWSQYLEVDSFPYVVRGEVIVSGVKAPFEHSGTIELN